MEVQFGPNSIDEPNLLYKLQRKLKVFNTDNSLQNQGYNLVSTSSKYGLVFIAVPEGSLSVYYLKELIDKDVEPQHLTVKLQEKPTHIAVSCDDEFLAVTGGQQLCIYKVDVFQNQDTPPAALFKTSANPSTFVSALQWNPVIPDSLAIAFYDGTLIAYQITTKQSKMVASKARCICWSPKGKQLVTGNSDGTLCQYKPDLTPAKTVPAPKLFEGSPVEALAIYWISTFQFAVVYKNATDNSRPAVTIVNTPKAGQPMCNNYEDICFSMGNSRPWYYYLHGISFWNTILASSSNSMEIATLGSKDSTNWQQWCQTDEARPELPLTDKKQENYPVGVCIDNCAIHRLPWGENQMLPHMPLLHVVSQSGLLTIFNIINLNKDATEVCFPPKQLILHAQSLTSHIPDACPSQSIPPSAPPPIVQPKPQPVVQTQPQIPVQPQIPSKPQLPQLQIPTPKFSIPTAEIKTLSSTQPLASQGFAAPAVPAYQAPQIQEHKDMKPAAINPPETTVQATTTPKPVAPKPIQTQENAAMKAEQERLNEIKANQELKNMLIKEVNDFQMELYKFMVKTRETQTKLQRNIESINTNFTLNNLDTEQLKKECCLDEMRGAIVQLKLELVRACAVVAEARAHAEAKDYQWSQADPLTTKRVASVKKLAYYVQTQLDQAHKALDYKWNELVSTNSQYNKPGHRMIRPILDDIYQPLVKQQEILSRQQAVLRSLRNTLNECDNAPIFKSTSLLRSTPFKNKDPLSKLTKNILNMSIETDSNRTKESLLTPQKLDALRDMLANHKTVKIKPVNVELRQHLATMRSNFQKGLKEKTIQPIVDVQIEPEVIIKREPQVNIVQTIPKAETIKVEHKPEPIKQPTGLPSFAVTSNLKPSAGNVVRTLFTDEPSQEFQAFQQSSHPPPLLQQNKLIQPSVGYGFPTTTAAATINTKSVLKDLLQSKQANNGSKKVSDNLFMGQPICSPSVFSFSSTPTDTGKPTIFTSKPIAEINNMFSKLEPQSFESKHQITPIAINPRSDETGELENTQDNKLSEVKYKTDKSAITNYPKATPLTTNSSNVPDVLHMHQPEKLTTKHVEKAKENNPEKDIVKITQKVTEIKEIKPLSAQSMNSKSLDYKCVSTPPLTESSATVTSNESLNPVVVKSEPKMEPVKVLQKSDISSSIASSLFAAANSEASAVSKPQLSGKSPTTEQDTKQVEPSISTQSDFSDNSQDTSATSVTSSLSASSIFGAAAASLPKSPSETGSIFSASSATNIFGDPAKSLFATAASTPNSAIGTSTGDSVISKTPVIDTPTSTPPKTSESKSHSSSELITSTVNSTASATIQKSIFGSPTSVFSAPISTLSQESVSSSATPLFGSAAKTTQSSAFGVSSTSNTSSPSVFSSSAPLFGTVVSSNQASVFGATTTTQSLFSTTATTSTQSSVFGGTGPSVFSTPTPASVFGAASSQSSIFGTATPSTQTSVFGTTTQSTQGSVFGMETGSAQPSVFSTPTTTQPSIFGTSPQQTQSVFGTPPTTTASSGSLFGGAESNLFAAASISTTSSPAQSSGGNIFGGSSSGSVFGGGSSNVFGGKTTFGQSNPTAASLFGGGGATSFGQKPATNFWGSGNASSPTAFGQQATTQASSIFGGGSGGSFSTPSTGQPFGSPTSNTTFGRSDANQSVFGSPQQQQQQPGAFGSSPVFGSNPVFGQSSGFGSPTSSGFGSGASFGGFNKSPTSGFGAAPSFGGGATFGGTGFGNTSPGKVFGGSSPPSFGSPTQANSTFESLATQNTLTFGNLAQQSGQPQQPAPSFKTSSFTGWRG